MPRTATSRAQRAKSAAATFGHIRGVPVNTTFINRKECMGAGVHALLLAGIHGRQEEGAFSVVMSGGYEDDEDKGYTFTYTGCAGRDTGDNGQLRDGPQTCDQSFDNPKNHSLWVSSHTGKPVRVIRGFKLASPYAPIDGYRYDGLYTVEQAFKERGKSGYMMCKYRFRRVDGQPPIPTKGGTVDVQVRRWRPPVDDSSDDEPAETPSRSPPLNLQAARDARAAPRPGAPATPALDSTSTRFQKRLSIPEYSMVRPGPANTERAPQSAAPPGALRLPRVPDTMPTFEPARRIAHVPTSRPAPAPAPTPFQGLHFKKRSREEEHRLPPRPQPPQDRFPRDPARPLDPRRPVEASGHAPVPPHPLPRNPAVTTRWVSQPVPTAPRAAHQPPPTAPRADRQPPPTEPRANRSSQLALPRRPLPTEPSHGTMPQPPRKLLPVGPPASSGLTPKPIRKLLPIGPLVDPRPPRKLLPIEPRDAPRAAPERAAPAPPVKMEDGELGLAETATVLPRDAVLDRAIKADPVPAAAAPPPHGAAPPISGAAQLAGQAGVETRGDEPFGEPVLLRVAPAAPPAPVDMEVCGGELEHEEGSVQPSEFIQPSELISMSDMMDVDQLEEGELLEVEGMDLQWPDGDPSSEY